MPIHYNGAANPLNVTYNGTSLDYVYASIGGEVVVGPVWEREAAGPETISVQSLVFSSGSNALFFRNMTYVSKVIFVEGGVGILYRGDVTFETSFNPSRQIGPTLPYSADYVWSPNESGLRGTFGGALPSNYKFAKAMSTSTTSSMSFDVYKTNDGVLRPEQRVVMDLPTRVEYEMDVNNTVTARFITEATGNAWPVLTRTSGWIYQGTGELIVKRT